MAAAVLLALAAPAAARAKPELKGWTGPKPQVECYCRHKQGRARLGETVCLERGGERVTARCEKPLNLPLWRVIAQGCDAPNS